MGGMGLPRIEAVYCVLRLALAIVDHGDQSAEPTTGMGYIATVKRADDFPCLRQAEKEFHESDAVRQWEKAALLVV